MDIMLDLETLGKSPSALFFRIGWAVFDQQSIYSSGAIPVDPQSALDHGLEVDGDTITWWMGQPDEARRQIYDRGNTLPTALEILTNTFYRWGPKRVWCRGPDFDLAILRNAYRAVGLTKPWGHGAGRDVRTLADVTGVKYDRSGGVAHDAQSDAVRQARHVRACLAALDPRGAAGAVVLDFDGVLHSYTSGWKGADVIPDPPVTGAIEWLRRLVQAKEWPVAICSARSSQPGGREAMREWLEHWAREEHLDAVSAWVSEVQFPLVKPGAHLMIDDRVMRFAGRFPSLEEIKEFQPWWKEPKDG